MPRGKAAFLWGARKTGKSTFLSHEYPESLRVDLLLSDTFYDLLRTPSLLREQLILSAERGTLTQPVIIDEVQKIPALLDEVHWLIENKKISFILCGSSARKLKRGHANLLGGRAWRFVMHPFVSAEIGDFDLLRALNHGLIPDHYHENDYRRSQKGYVVDYLREEIMAEGLTRNIAAFSRFTDVLGFCTGEMINYSNIARDCGVDSKTIREYFQIVADTNLGFFVEPFTKRRKRNIISSTPKFYLFDTGIANFLSRQTIEEEKGPQFGRSFEHFIFTELIAYNDYKECDKTIRYWRTVQGQEVDFVIDDAEAIIEVKGASRVDAADLRHLHSFTNEYKPRKAIVVSNELKPRKSGEIQLYPWRLFLEMLWRGEIFDA
ncbi:MAG: ATP-binding protein [Chitinispirillaceae bacterium]|nr:ATP-binding protein [Chitinispirillaceae bacterium]